MADGDDLLVPATIADIKAIETSIGSTIDTKDSPPKPTLEDTLASDDGDSEGAKEKRKRDEEEKLKNSSEAALKGSTSTSPAAKLKGKDGDYHAMAHQHSLDPPVPHHRVTPFGLHHLLMCLHLLASNTQ